MYSTYIPLFTGPDRLYARIDREYLLRALLAAKTGPDRTSKWMQLPEFDPYIEHPSEQDWNCATFDLARDAGVLQVKVSFIYMNYIREQLLKTRNANSKTVRLFVASTVLRWPHEVAVPATSAHVAFVRTYWRRGLRLVIPVERLDFLDMCAKMSARLSTYVTFVMDYTTRHAGVEFEVYEGAHER